MLDNSNGRGPSESRRKGSSNDSHDSKSNNSSSQNNGEPPSNGSNQGKEPPRKDASKGEGQNFDKKDLPKLPRPPVPEDPFEGLSPAAKRGLKKFLKQDPNPGDTHYMFIQKHGDTGDESFEKSEAHTLVQNYTQQRMIAKHTIIPNLERQIKELDLEKMQLQARIKRVQKAFKLETDSISKPPQAKKITSFRATSPQQKEALRDAVKKVEHALMTNIIGQPEAIKSVVKPLQRAVTGVADPNRPLSTLFFAGSTGIGKTLTADVLAGTLKNVSPEVSFDYLTINCAEFQNKHEVSSRNLGAPPGYIGFDQGGLFDALKDNPFHVVLLDEIEKADPAFFQLLLQVLEKGEATMANGDKISFKNAIIIMTSNVGTHDLQKALNPLGLNQPETLSTEDTKDIVDHALKKSFAPEFLNRIDQRVYFQQLSRADTRKIAALEVQKVIARAEESNQTLIEVKPEVYDFLVKKGYSSAYGARFMRKTVQRYIQDKLGDKFFEFTPEKIVSSKFVFEVRDGKLKLNVYDRNLPKLDQAA